MNQLCDHAVCLVVDKRHQREWPRIRNLFKDRVGSIECFLDGTGSYYPRSFYDQLTLPIPPGWRHGQGGFQHFSAVQKIVQRAKDEGWPEVLFIEDDCLLNNNFDQVVKQAQDALGRLPPWDLLYYGANHSDAVTVELAPFVLKVVGSLTSHMVQIREKAYDWILALRPTHMIDYLIANSVQARCNAFAIWPSVATQKPGPSAIWGIQTDYTECFTSKGSNW